VHEPPATGSDAPVPQEIERTFLLDGLPSLPPHAEAHRLEQGYLPDPAPGGDARPEDEHGVPCIGRLRRSVGPDGVERLTHTIKRGVGLVREERERTIDRPAFDAAWPRTAGRRITKTRHVVREVDGLAWEVDVFDDRPLVLVDVELPRADTASPFPAWLAGHVVREVTDDPAYTNSALAGVRRPPKAP
jgi:CYTH domain-containing protein